MKKVKVKAQLNDRRYHKIRVIYHGMVDDNFPVRVEFENETNSYSMLLSENGAKDLAEQLQDLLGSFAGIIV